jgi:hypothetical protein
LLKLKRRFCSTNFGSCCQAQRLAAMQVTIRKEFTFK